MKRLALVLLPALALAEATGMTHNPRFAAATAAANAVAR